MTFTLRIDLEDSNYFWNVMRNRRSLQPQTSEEILINNTKKLCNELETTVEPFISEQINKLQYLAAMIEDPNWPLPPQEREDILAVLSYFNEPEVLIANNIPTLGRLDDAIMIELVANSLTESIKTFQEYCAYRDSEHLRSASKLVTKQSWLNDKRHEKHDRLRLRHARSHCSSGSFHSMF